jgi:hypothetical protein
VHYRHVATGGELSNAADIACRDEVWSGPGDVGELAVPQRRCDLGLQQVIGSGRTAAEMPLRHVNGLETRCGKQLLRSGVNSLAVLHRTSRMVGDPRSGFDHTGGQPSEPKRCDYLGYIAGERSDPSRLTSVIRIFTQHEPVILDCRPAT